jgi:hypothetical protein
MGWKNTSSLGAWIGMSWGERYPLLLPLKFNWCCLQMSSRVRIDISRLRLVLGRWCSNACQSVTGIPNVHPQDKEKIARLTRIKILRETRGMPLIQNQIREKSNHEASKFRKQ